MIRIITFLIFIIFSLQLHGQDVSDLSKRQEKEYNKRKLTLKIKGRPPVTDDSNFETTEGLTWKKWFVIEGKNTKIGEVEFFDITDHGNETKAAKQHRSIPRLLLTGGSILTLAGIGMMYYHKVNEKYNAKRDWIETEREFPLVIPGAAIGVVGASMGIYGKFRLSKNWAPYTTAKGIIDEYNYKVKQWVKKKFKKRGNEETDLRYDR